jgi:hypothetical protein
MKRSMDTSGAILLPFIFNDVASDTLVELAALAAVATSAVLCAVGVASEAVLPPPLPPQPPNASESDRQAALVSARRTHAFDPVRLRIKFFLHKLSGPLLRLSVRTISPSLLRFIMTTRCC